MNLIETDNKVKLVDNTDNLVSSIIEEDDIEKTKQLLNLFNVNIAKKNTLRVMKVDKLLDKVVDEALERVEARPDEINNKDLIAYASVAQTQIDKSMQIIKSVNETPAIQLNQQNNINVNIGTELSKESRERVLKAVEQILNQDNIVDAEIKK